MQRIDLLSRLHGVLALDLFKIGQTPITLTTLVSVALVVLVSFTASRLLRAALHRALVRQGVADEGSVAVVSRLVHYGIVATGIAIALQTAGIELGALFAAGAVFAVGIGFGLQNIAQNFVSGVILLVERSIKPGDVIEVEARLVKVQKMGIRATLVRTLDEEDLIVPNSTLAQSTVKNYTLHDSLYRVRVKVGVAYSSDVELVKSTLENVAQGVPWRAVDHPPRVLISEFGASSVEFEVSVWMREPWRHQQLRAELREAIWWAFKRASVVMAFPQLDVHFDTGLLLPSHTGPAGKS